MKSHTWDHIDHLIQARFVDSGSDTTKTVDFHYCRTCSGSRTEKIVKDEYGFITEWLRYEMEGLNHLRIDERYDSPGDANSVIDDNDPWRVQRVYYNGPGQLGQIVKATVWDYTSTPTATDFYYGYDILGNVSVISASDGTELDQFEQDAFGNEVEGSWTGGVGSIITERLTTKQYDTDLGMYYFNARLYDRDSGTMLSTDKAKSYQNAPDINGYELARSNPLQYVDPSGNVSIQACCRTVGAAEAEYHYGVKHCWILLPGDGALLARSTLSLFPQGWSWWRWNFGNGIPALNAPTDYGAQSADCCDLCEQDILGNRIKLLAEFAAYGTPPYHPLKRNSNTFARTLLTNCNFSFDGCSNIRYAAGWWVKDRQFE